MIPVLTDPHPFRRSEWRIFVLAYCRGIGSDHCDILCCLSGFIFLWALHERINECPGLNTQGHIEGIGRFMSVDGQVQYSAVIESKHHVHMPS
jgi:hypothetical protein